MQQNAKKVEDLSTLNALWRTHNFKLKKKYCKPSRFVDYTGLKQLLTRPVV